MHIISLLILRMLSMDCFRLTCDDNLRLEAIVVVIEVVDKNREWIDVDSRL